MFMVRKGEIREVEVLDLKEGFYSVKDKKNNEILSKIHKTDVCETYEEVKLIQKEYEIKIKFKKNRKNKNGFHTCSWCGKKGKNLTLDHKEPLDSFGGKKQIRKNEKIWRKAWSIKNLQMLCEECNKHKANYKNLEGTMELDDIDYHARILNNKKLLTKSVHKDSPSTKIGYGIATSKRANQRKELAVYVAKADSNILRLDSIFGRKEAYDKLPKTV